jgi:hypothetical protein
MDYGFRVLHQQAKTCFRESFYCFRSNAQSRHLFRGSETEATYKLIGESQRCRKKELFVDGGWLTSNY